MSPNYVRDNFSNLDRCQNVLVIPTIRPECLQRFIREWNVSYLTPDKSSVVLPWDAVVVVCDMPEPLDVPELHNAMSLDVATGSVKSKLHVEILSRQSIEECEQTKHVCQLVFSYGDSAIRCFGYWWAWNFLRSDDGTPQVIFSIDDDCYPAPPTDSEYSKAEKAFNFVASHIEALSGISNTRWQSTIPGTRVRGLPYANLGNTPSVLHVGLWENVLDLDATDTLSRIASGKPTENMRIDVSNYTWNPHCLYPMSGMNIAFRSEIAPFMYYPKQGLGTQYGRFDDIWCGLIVQRMCGLLGFPITCGRPYVWHSRASNVFANLIKEARGVYLNEHLWRAIDAADVVSEACAHADIGNPRGYHALVRKLGESLISTDSSIYLPDSPYVRNVGESIIAWSGLFNEDG